MQHPLWDEQCGTTTIASPCHADGRRGYHLWTANHSNLPLSTEGGRHSSWGRFSDFQSNRLIGYSSGTVPVLHRSCPFKPSPVQVMTPLKIDVNASCLRQYSRYPERRYPPFWLAVNSSLPISEGGDNLIVSTSVTENDYLTGTWLERCR